MIGSRKTWHRSIGCAAFAVLAPLGCNLNPLTEDPGFGNDETPDVSAGPTVDNGFPSGDNGSVVTPGPLASDPGAVTEPASPNEPELIVDGAEPAAPPAADPGPLPDPVATTTTPLPADSPGAVEPIPDAGAPEVDAGSLEATTFGTMDATIDDGGP